ncbi:glycosyltransferase family 4 protein [Leptospira paudalimensis]|uniref:Glycosyltransferase family 4 protein n=1 Tax=Leptospira paudalimensis TaxID=2950024 RepID=A0ABT3M5V0_9LEPT|nr:glycosyltransferase family 4 protein [Leptospira paudalimensis]MCW7503753.1 glycosyltransferase family 4 protein [Leptospira paudalimensis]
MENQANQNLAILIDDYLPNSTKVASKMMHELAIELHARGFTIDVITPIIRKGKKSILKKEKLVIDQINVFTFDSGEIKEASKVVRLVNELLMPYRALYAFFRHFYSRKYKYVITYSPSIFWYPLVYFFRFQFKTKSYLVLRDFFPQWVIDSGIIKENSLVTKFLRWHEKMNYLAFDTIGIQSPKNLAWFQEKYQKLNLKSELLYNWVTPSIMYVDSKKNTVKKFRTKYNLQSKLLFFYGGNIGHAQDMKNLLTLAEQMLAEKDVFFIFIGSGDEVNLVKETIQNRNLKNTLYLESVSQDEYMSILSEVDVGLFSLSPHHSTHNFPGKILSYCQLALPILGAVNSGNDIIEVIEGSGSGKISIAGNSDALIQNAKLFLDAKIREQMSKNSLRLMEEYFSTSKSAESIIKALN